MKNNKIRLLLIKDQLIKHSDPCNPLTFDQINNNLVNHDINCNRKSIYNDIKILCDYGYVIEFIKSHPMGYVLHNKQFDNIEIKLLIDAINASSFISQSKSLKLIEKIEDTTSKNEIDSLRFNVNYKKTSNEHIIYIIDDIQRAIGSDYKIYFKYFDLNITKDKKYRKKNSTYSAIPYALIWENQKYYCVMYSDEHQDFRTYRVDKMDNVKVVEQKKYDKIDFDYKKYQLEQVQMFNGETFAVTLKFNNISTLSNAVFDQFGYDILVIEVTDEYFIININVAISPTFYSWLVQFNNQVSIIQPINIKNDYISYLKRIINNQD